MNVDLRSLRYFVAMATFGSISRAAEQLNVAQPGLSLQLKKLETDLGVQLLERTAKGVILTVPGQRLLSHSREILERVEFACDDVRGSSSEPIGTVAVGMPQSIGMALTVRLVSEVLKKWPRLQLQVIEIATGDVPNHLAARTIDLGVTFLSQRNDGLRYRKLVQEELVLIGPSGAFSSAKSRTLQRAQTISFQCLKDLPLFLPSPKQSLRQLLERYAGRSKIKLNVRADVDAIPQLISLASNGVGYSILSYPSVREDFQRGTVSIARLKKPEVFRGVFLCRLANAPMTSAVATIESMIVSTVDSLVREGAWPGKVADRSAPRIR